MKENPEMLLNTLKLLEKPLLMNWKLKKISNIDLLKPAPLKKFKKLTPKNLKTLFWELKTLLMGETNKKLLKPLMKSMKPLNKMLNLNSSKLLKLMLKKP